VYCWALNETIRSRGLGEFREFREFREFGEFGEWGAGSTKEWTSRGRHERMRVLVGSWRRIGSRRGTQDSDWGIYLPCGLPNHSICTDPSSPGRRRFHGGEEYI